VALVTAITLPVGLLVGILSGYYGGWLERILMRFTDVVMSMPRLILAFAFVAMLGPGLVNGALALALTTWPAYARQARSEIQRLRHSDYLAAAEMLGIRGWRLLMAIFCRCACLPPSCAWRWIWPALFSPPPGSASSASAPVRRWRNGGDDRRRNAGHFRSVVDCRRARRGDPDSQPGV
jgi:peptide/nickel transport system permease protein